MRWQLVPCYAVSLPRLCPRQYSPYLQCSCRTRRLARGLSRMRHFPTDFSSEGSERKMPRKDCGDGYGGCHLPGAPRTARSSEGAQVGRCTFMWTLHRKSSVSGPALPGSYSWKKRGAKRKEAKAERAELTARRDSWGHSHSVGTACGEGRGHRCPPSSHPAPSMLHTPLSVGSR